MKSCLTLLLTVLFLQPASGQSNNSDAFTPIPMPAPVPPASLKKVTLNTSTATIDTICKPPKKLLTFSLPGCIDATSAVAAIAKTTFSESMCPAEVVVYNPSILALSDSNYSKEVTATAGDVSLTADVFVVNSTISTGFTPIQIDYRSIEETLQTTLQSLTHTAGFQSRRTGAIPVINLGYESYQLCCPYVSPSVKVAKKYTGSAASYFGLNCSFPVYSIPFISGGNAVVNAFANLSTGLGYTSACDTAKAYTPVNGTLRLTGTVGVPTNIPGVFVDLKIKGGGVFKGSWSFYPANDKPEGRWLLEPVKLYGNVSTAWGWVTHAVETSLYNQ